MSKWLCTVGCCPYKTIAHFNVEKQEQNSYKKLQFVNKSKRAGEKPTLWLLWFQLLPAVRQPDKYGDMQDDSGDIYRPEIHMLGFVAEHLHSQKAADRAAG